VGGYQNQPNEVLMNLKLKDPTNQNSSFQFEKKKLLIKENEAGD